MSGDGTVRGQIRAKGGPEVQDPLKPGIGRRHAKIELPGQIEDVMARTWKGVGAIFLVKTGGL